MSTPFGLYAHIPFCLHKCPYCDFNSYSIEDPGRSSELKRLREFGFARVEKEYADALVRELGMLGNQDIWLGRECRSVFLGGGTPSLLTPESVAKLLDRARQLFRFTDDCEITLECNPGTVREQLGRDKLVGFRAAGVNRISLGCQSFSDRKLSVLGRIHAAADIEHAINGIKAAGYTSWSLDLMFGVEGESVEEWLYDLSRALLFSPPHLSAYCLTIEPGTEFGRLERKGVSRSADEPLQLELFQATRRTLESSGYPAYEISNFAPAGSECRHNVGYWKGEDYLGLGAGAHSFCAEGRADGALRWSNVPGPQLYVERVVKDGEASIRSETLDESQKELEFFFLRLRTTEGLGFDDYERRFGEQLDVRYLDLIEELVADGLLTVRERDATPGAYPPGVALSERGVLFANTILERFAIASPVD